MAEDRESRGGLGGFVRRSGYLRKWLILGISIGIIAGLGAVTFYLMLDYSGRFLLGFLGGYTVPTAHGDGGARGSTSFDRAWAIPLITLGGALAAAYIVYREDFEYRSLIPGFITSGTAYAIYGSILGFQPLFGFVAPSYNFDARQLVWFLLIGIVSAAIGYLYARVFYGTVTLTKRLPGGSVLKPAVGGLLVGLLALLIPQILSSGYGWAQLAAAKDTLLTIPLWIVLILPFAKIVATSLSIGTGGSGGIFGPGIVIGAFVGAAIWRLADLAGAPGIPEGPGVFVVVAMMACFGSVAHAPLAVMIMVAEMTGSFSVIAGAMIAVGIAYLLITLSSVSIYKVPRLNRDSV